LATDSLWLGWLIILRGGTTMEINGCSCRACSTYAFQGAFGNDKAKKPVPPEPHEPEGYKVPEKSVHDRVSALPENIAQMDKLQILIECNSLATEIDTIDEELHKIQKLLADKGYGEIALEIAKLSQRLN